MHAHAKPHISKQLSRYRVQGTQDIDQVTLDEIGNWLRLAVATCAVLAATGTVLASPIFFYALVPIALASAIFEVHPVDHIYNHLIRRFSGTRPLPKRGIPTRLACGIGAVMMVIAVFAFSSGATAFGYAMGGQVAFIAGLAATTDI